MIPRILMPLLAGFLSLCVGCANSDGAQHDQDAVHQGPAMNFHRINPRLATGGHFVNAGATELAKQGVTLVIDLRDEPPKDAQRQLEAAGIRWINVPVVWAEPKRNDFEDFSRLMAANEGESIFVQCQANYRASAMTYLYRVTSQRVSEPEARKDLNAIWTPEGTWESYIDEILSAD
jgi:protein tyrosine phosphatase (PTP) superfamily phosphohydrolase (DUF442 family)